MKVTPRPTPLRDSAATWAKIVGIGSGLVTSLATAGVLSADQAGALGAGLTKLDLLAAAIIGVITAGASVVAALRTARSGEPLVTPLSSPMNNDGQMLVPGEPPPPPLPDALV